MDTRRTSEMGGLHKLRRKWGGDHAYGSRMVVIAGGWGSFLSVDSTTFLKLFYILQQKMRSFSTSTDRSKILHLQS